MITVTIERMSTRPPARSISSLNPSGRTRPSVSVEGFKRFAPRDTTGPRATVTVRVMASWGLSVLACVIIAIAWRSQRDHPVRPGRFLARSGARRKGIDFDGGWGMFPPRGSVVFVHSAFCFYFCGFCSGACAASMRDDGWIDGSPHECTSGSWARSRCWRWMAPASLAGTRSREGLG
ncbi:hypothetical protein SEVIR_9G525401v4 [Setaria viridis]